MAAMPRPRKPYIQREVTRHGRTVWYFRRGKEKRIRLDGDYGSTEFEASYHAALTGLPIKPHISTPRTTLRWLVDRYMESGRFVRLAPGTQKMRRAILLNVCSTGGERSFATITTKDIMKGKVRREATPFAAQNYVKVMNQLFAFAVDAGYLEENPATKADKSAPATDGHHTWTIEEVEQFREAHPIGTQAHLALDVLLYTGLRRGDAAKIGHQHIRNGLIRYRATKNGMEIAIPLLPPLAASIAATKTGDLALLCNSRGGPWTTESFGNWFADQCIAAGVPGRAHGLRKAGATFAAQNGANELDLAAMYGWKNTRMAEVYIRKANRMAGAERAANALYPHQQSGCGDQSRKISKNSA
ncbi:tyrosine-type recombinase/integrase [Aliihoeflea sp. 40Bstr573]|uniref:tyrosine-type recombinase/integrase n=1 Tax=Aliihoeflea sp. 40Bstr573 TaxID=2696467 RepID=UPI0020963D5E|nr:tyrosine-type recombinase/integrase [Aliihoeflea sp. 40Bstr573]MCO6386387.1 tyrosine-type recombinase/integrase [Aliihoeflea sp. 40Bstr573]